MSETIPEEVMKAAREVYDDVMINREPMTSDSVAAIARALLARDERAAKIVTEKQEQAAKFLAGVSMGGADSWSARGAISACRDIASAIRDRSRT